MSRASSDEQWSGAGVPHQTGRTAVITGASSGVGFQAAKALTELGAQVVLACRNMQKAKAAADRIIAVTPHAALHLVHLDLSSLASVRNASQELLDSYGAIDLLINNAGVMWAPHEHTVDGVEMHLGVNHLGHFALTGLILDRLLVAEGSRIVVVTSPSHRQGRLDLDDLDNGAHYNRGAAYARSKLANLLFTYELQRRLAAASASTIALAAHPGAARTELNRHMPRPFRGASWGLSRPLTHSAEKGVLPLLRAALDPAAAGGDYIAPSGKREFKGCPVRRESSDLSHDRQLQSRLWQISEDLCAVSYEISPPAR